MSARLQSVLSDLRDQLGATPADLTPDELERLVFACARVDNPFSMANAELMERPVRVCEGVYLWPITAGAQVWLSEYAATWWKVGSFMFGWATFYALMNARNPDAFASLTTRAKARSAVLAAALRLCCHRRELDSAAQRCYGVWPREEQRRQPANGTTDKACADFAGIVARLEVASGIPSSEWLWGRSIVSLMKSYAELTELTVAAFGPSCENQKTELDEAIENLARVCASIGRRLKEKHE